MGRTARRLSFMLLDQPVLLLVVVVVVVVVVVDVYVYKFRKYRATQVISVPCIPAG